MFDITNFIEREVKGLATLVRITEDALAISYKKFDQDSGKELAEEVIGGNIKEVTDIKAILQKEIDEIDVFVAKFNALIAQNKEVV